jgi:hypothetical protein
MRITTDQNKMKIPMQVYGNASAASKNATALEVYKSSVGGAPHFEGLESQEPGK